MISDVLVGEAFRWDSVECIAVQTVDVLGLDFLLPVFLHASSIGSFPSGYSATPDGFGRVC